MLLPRASVPLPAVTGELLLSGSSPWKISSLQQNKACKEKPSKTAEKYYSILIIFPLERGKKKPMIS